MKCIIVGLGNIGTKRLEVSKNQIVATVDPNNKLADYKKLDNVKHNSYDTVILSCPQEQKIRYIQKLLKLKKNVLVEKPLILKNTNKLKNIFKKFQEKKLVLYVAYNLRFEPHIIKAKKILDKKTLGKIYYCEYSYLNGTSLNNKKSIWKTKIKLGVTHDLLPHLIDLHHYLLGKKVDKSYMKNIYKIESKNADHAYFFFKKNRINFRISYLCWKNEFKVKIVGSKGDLELSGLSKWGKTKLILRNRIMPSGKPIEKIIKTNQIIDTHLNEYNFLKKAVNKKTYIKDDTTFIINEFINNY
jgi:scyllo-inositol 2-dehydrogenase (NADP+)